MVGTIKLLSLRMRGIPIIVRVRGDKYSLSTLPWKKIFFSWEKILYLGLNK